MEQHFSQIYRKEKTVWTWEKGKQKTKMFSKFTNVNESATSVQWKWAELCK